MNVRDNIVVITGPTGSGKSQFALQLAKTLPLEIISADSVQVYRGFDIGSAKPDTQELQLVPHHLISLLDAEERFDAGRFRVLAEQAIAEIRSRKRLPLVVGGTGLYISVLLGGLVETGEVSDEAIGELEELEERLQSEGKSRSEISQALHNKLAALDSHTALSLRPPDYARVRRALLVAFSTGKSLRSLQQAHGHGVRRHNALVICLLPDRRKLYKSLDARVERMLEAGFITEVETLLSQYAKVLQPQTADQLMLQPFGSIGYRHVCSYLYGKLSKSAMIELWKRDTRRFAKRQYTWWNHQPSRLGWCEFQLKMGQAQPEALGELVKQFFQEKPDLTEAQVKYIRLSDTNFVE